MTPIFQFEAVEYHYPGHQNRSALQGLTMSLPAHEKIAVIGRNGSGKSTMLLHCNGLYRPQAGRIFFNGQPLAYNRAAIKQLRQQVGLVFQNPDDQLFSASVAQDISFGPLNLGLSVPEVRERVNEAARMCDITKLLERPTHALSGGEKARVALAGVLAMRPTVLLGDEVTATLDPWARLAILQILDRFHADGHTIILATHNLEFVQQWATQVVVMVHGQTVFTGAPQTLWADVEIMNETGLAQLW